MWSGQEILGEWRVGEIERARECVHLTEFDWAVIEAIVRFARQKIPELAVRSRVIFFDQSDWVQAQSLTKGQWPVEVTIELIAQDSLAVSWSKYPIGVGICRLHWDEEKPKRRYGQELASWNSETQAMDGESFAQVVCELLRLVLEHQASNRGPVRG